jgi:hypothetical protein
MSALAIYGTRAANGVILLPKGKEKGSAEIGSFAGFREHLKK